MKSIKQRGSFCNKEAVSAEQSHLHDEVDVEGQAEDYDKHADKIDGSIVPFPPSAVILVVPVIVLHHFRPQMISGCDTIIDA